MSEVCTPIIRFYEFWALLYLFEKFKKGLENMNIIYKDIMQKLSHLTIYKRKFVKASL